MDKTEICKICNKRFANGKAMGGHMRSHLHFAKVNPIIPTKPNSQKPFSPPTTSSSSSSSYSSSSSLNYSLESYPKLATNPASVSTLAANPSGGFGSSEAESVRNPTRRRSKRRRKSVEKVSESMHFKVGDRYYSDPGRVSSSTFASDNNNSLCEEDAATSLLMLSYEYDKIKRGKGVVSEEEGQVVVEASIEKFVEEEDMEEGEIKVEKEVGDGEDEPYKFSISRSDHTSADVSDPIGAPKFSTPLPPPKQPKPSSKGKFRCETCDKGFKSYQALGGHKASHKKLRPSGSSLASNKEAPPQKYEDHGSAIGGLVLGRRVFKCSFCDKEFESGQALGGHKKVHFPYLGNNPIPNPKTSATATSSSVVAATRVVKNLIDLNLLPPEAHEDL